MSSARISDTARDGITATVDTAASQITGVHSTRGLDTPPELVRIEACALVARLAVERLDAAVDSARQSKATWQQIGDALGITKQAAWERFHRFGEPASPLFPNGRCPTCGNGLDDENSCQDDTCQEFCSVIPQGERA